MNGKKVWALHKPMKIYNRLHFLKCSFSVSKHTEKTKIITEVKNKLQRFWGEIRSSENLIREIEKRQKNNQDNENEIQS